MRTRLLMFLVPLLLAFGTSAGAATFVTVSATPLTGGTVSAPAILGKNTVNGSLDVTFTPNAGYYVSKVTWKKDALPATVDLTTDAAVAKSYTRTFVDDGTSHTYTIAAVFAKKPTVTATATPLVGGNKVSPTGVRSVDFGSDLTVSVLSGSGYHIKSLIVDALPVPIIASRNEPVFKSHTFQGIVKNHVVKAVLTLNTYNVSATAGPGGTITPATTTAIHGQTKLFTIKPAALMRIASVTVNDVPVDVLPATGPYVLTRPITADTQIDVTFAELRPSGVARLKGTYSVVARESNFSGSNNFVSNSINGNVLTMTFNGLGGCTLKGNGFGFTGNIGFNEVQSVNVSTDNNPLTPCTYIVSDDGTFTMSFTTPDGPQTVVGGVSLDGNFFVTSGPAPQGGEAAVGTVAGVRAGAAMTRAAMTGKYNIVSQYADFFKSNPPNAGVSYGIDGEKIVATFNADGTCAIDINGQNFSANIGNGTLNTDQPKTEAITCTYAITSTGAFTIKQGLTTLVSGWASADGNAILLGRAQQQVSTNGTEYSTELVVGVKEGATLDLSSLSGTYRVVGSELGIFDGGFSMHSSAATATFFGDGTCSISSDGKGYSMPAGGTGTVNTSDDAGITTSCTYSVTPQGEFTLNMDFGGGPEQPVDGHVSADGNTFVVGGARLENSFGPLTGKSELIYGTRILP